MKPKLGTGARFKTLENKMVKQGVKNPKAVAAKIGMEKYGKDKMMKMASAGKKKSK